MVASSPILILHPRFKRNAPLPENLVVPPFLTIISVFKVTSPPLICASPEISVVTSESPSSIPSELASSLSPLPSTNVAPFSIVKVSSS